MKIAHFLCSPLKINLLLVKFYYLPQFNQYNNNDDDDDDDDI